MFRFKLKKAKALLVALPLTVVFLTQTALAASYTVVQGDSLYKIGTTFNTSVDSLKQNNGLAGSLIYAGQVLNVPARVYTVKSGDSLYLIARNNGISLYSLRKANNKWNDVIYPGQTLLLPMSSASSSGGATQGNTQSGSAVIPYNSNDLDLLARLITAEAGSQPYSAQVSVGAVVVNRVKDPRFPNTISGVIYEVSSNGYYQFTPVENGWIYKPATQDARNAAYEALHGADPTHGAVYYFDDSATNRWLWSKPIAARIGNMVYTY